MDEELHLKIYDRLGKLDAGIEGINRRLDITNGRIAKVENGQDGFTAEIAVLKTNNNRDEKEKDWKCQLWMQLAKGVAGVIWIIISGLGLIILQRTGILNLAIVESQVYEQVEQITQ